MTVTTGVDPTDVAPSAAPVPEQDVTAGPLSHNKLCNLGDFAHPDLRDELVAVFPDLHRDRGPGWPERSPLVERKFWEIAMAIRAFRDFGVLHDEAEVLGVGAGHERTLYALTNHVRRVFATDLYCAAGAWVDDAAQTMLRDPAEFAYIPWNPRRLVVQHMSGTDLDYEDESFDGIFSSSSIEHFGGLDDVRRAAEEMFRVLKPGGVLSLSTEFRLTGPPGGIPGALLFDLAELDEAIIGGLDWSLVSEPDFTLSDATFSTALDFEEAIRLHSSGLQVPAHCLLHQGPHMWTSIHLALMKGHSAS